MVAGWKSEFGEKDMGQALEVGNGAGDNPLKQVLLY